MMAVRILWWRLSDLEVSLMWTVNRAALPGAAAVLGLGLLWMVARVSFRPAGIAWVVSVLGLAFAGNTFTLVALWVANSLLTLLIFRNDREGEGRGLQTFAFAEALCHFGLFFGYVYFSAFFEDSTIPTLPQYLEAVRQQTDLPGKSLGTLAAFAASSRLIFGSGSLWLPGEPILGGREWLGNRFLPLVLPAAIFVQKMAFLWSIGPRKFYAVCFVAVVASVFCSLTRNLGLHLSDWLNPARWFQELVERPLRRITTFVDRWASTRFIEGLILLPGQLARIASLGISYLQSGSIADYLTMGAVGLTLLALWILGLGGSQ